MVPAVIVYCKTQKNYAYRYPRILKAEVICHANNFAVCEAAIFNGSQTGEAGGT
jgi:hypothetical protein